MSEKQAYRVVNLANAGLLQELLDLPEAERPDLGERMHRGGENGTFTLFEDGSVRLFHPSFGARAFEDLPALVQTMRRADQTTERLMLECLPAEYVNSYKGKARFTVAIGRHFEDAPRERIAEACGLLLEWAYACPMERSLKEYLLEQYQFPVSSIDAKIDLTSGRWTYPGDPPLYPMVRVEQNGEVLYIYQYALVAFVSPEGEVYATRMD